MRVGVGYDIHRLVPGRRLILGSVAVPHSSGLLGHSDADVVLHAIIDALLGAAGLGDIGQHFPPSDDRYRDAASTDLLRRVTELLADRGYAAVNVDVTVRAERPRLGNHVPAMRAAVAGILGLENDAVNVKATTNEGVGPEGREEAISATAVALIQRAS